MSRSLYISPISDPASLAPGTELLVPSTLHPGQYPGLAVHVPAGSRVAVTDALPLPGELCVNLVTSEGTVTLTLPARALVALVPHPFRR